MMTVFMCVVKIRIMWNLLAIAIVFFGDRQKNISICNKKMRPIDINIILGIFIANLLIELLRLNVEWTSKNIAIAIASSLAIYYTIAPSL